MIPPHPYAGLLADFVGLCRTSFGEDLVGVYLHGSSVLGCFHPKGSDIDILVVAEREPSAEEKRRFLEGVIPLSAGTPCHGIETSVVPRAACDPPVHPMPYWLHFAEWVAARYREDPEGTIAALRGVDRDLAAHAAVTKAYGVALWGKPVDEVFGDVSRADYADAILYDVENAPEEIAAHPVYLTLNLCRGLAYLREGLILSKAGGGEWAIAHLPARFRPWIRRALSAYLSGSGMTEEDGDEDTGRGFAGYMLGQIREAL